MFKRFTKIVKRLRDFCKRIRKPFKRLLNAYKRILNAYKRILPLNGKALVSVFAFQVTCCFAEDGKEIYHTVFARAQPLFCSFNIFVSRRPCCRHRCGFRKVHNNLLILGRNTIGG